MGACICHSRNYVKDNVKMKELKTVAGAFGMCVHASVIVTLAFVCQQTKSVMMDARVMRTLIIGEDVVPDWTAHGTLKKPAKRTARAHKTLLESTTFTKRLRSAARSILVLAA
mmetsp:Transcript_3028/g.5548  ORF Transcript_3028/g.5548 Transcript_3028/m.5548 type:complete len:113 (-) Transcript_3028:513-851(-)